MNPLQNLTNEQFQALKVASDKFCATFAAHRTNPTNFDALNAWDIATSEFMAAGNKDGLNIIASLLAALTTNKELITEQRQIIAELKARPVAPLKFSESADADYCREWAWNETKKELNTEHWKTEDNGNFYGFFLTGWHARLQYNEQRRAENLRIAMISGLTSPLALELPPTRMTLAESKRRNMTWRELGSYNEGADVAVEKISKTLAAAGINLVLDGDAQIRKGDVS